MKKIIAVLLGIIMILSINTANVCAAEKTIILDNPVVASGSSRVTISGRINNYSHSYWSRYSAAVTVIRDGEFLGAEEDNSSNIVNVAECGIDENGKFSYTFKHNFMSESDSCKVFVSIPGMKTQTAHYTINSATEQADIFGGNIIMCLHSPLYFSEGIKYETDNIPYESDGSVYLPVQAINMDNAEFEGAYIKAEELPEYGLKADIFKENGIVCIGKGISEKQAESIRMEFGIHVSISGSDDNDGSAAKPVAAITRAAEIAECMDGEADIFVHEGTYEETLDITGEYEKLRIRGLGDVSLKPPALSLSSDCFRHVTDTDVLSQLPYNARGNVVYADITGCTDNIGDISGILSREKSYYKIYQDGTEMTNARWPNGYAFEYTTSEAPDMHDKLSNATELVYYDNPEKLALWKQADNAHACIFRSSGYYASRKKIVGIDEDEKTITFDYKIASGQKIGDRFYVYNLLQELDIPGEFYIDTQKQRLYFYPSGEFDNVEIAVSAEDVISISSASDVSIENINIGQTRGSGVRISDSSDISIKNCKISGTGSYGIIGKNCTGTAIDSCIVNGISNDGILLNYGENTDCNLTAQNNSIVNCHVYDVGKDNPIAGAVYLGGTGNTAAHNTINDTPHMAVWFGGNDNTVEYNEIYNALKYCDDAGVIYANPGILGFGNIVQYNYVHDCMNFNRTPSELYLIYLDWNTSGVTVRNNIFEIPENEVFAFGLFGGGRNNTLESNVFAGDSVFALSNRYEQGSLHDNLVSGHYLTDFIEGLSEEQRMLWFEKYPGIEDEYYRYTNDNDYTDVGLPLECTVANNIFAAPDMSEEKAFFWRKMKSGYLSTKKYAKEFSGNRFEESADTRDLPAKNAGCSLENKEKAEMLWPYNGSIVISGKQRLVWRRNGAVSYTVRISASSYFENCIVNTATPEDYADVELPEGIYYLDLNGEVIQFTVSNNMLKTPGGNLSEVACDGSLYLVSGYDGADISVKDSEGAVAAYKSSTERAGDKTVTKLIPKVILRPRHRYGVYINDSRIAEFETKDIITASLSVNPEAVSAEIVSELERTAVDAKLIFTDKKTQQLVGAAVMDIEMIEPGEKKTYIYADKMESDSEIYIWNSLSGMKPLAQKLSMKNILTKGGN